MTEKQRRFVEAYLLDPNATKAAIAAGYSEKTARQQGQRLLSNVVVAEYLAQAQEKRSERLEITADMVLAELWKNVSMARDAGDFNASNKAAELCDKHLGALTDRLHVTTDKNQAAQELADLLGITPEELLAFHSGERLVS